MLAPCMHSKSELAVREGSKSSSKLKEHKRVTLEAWQLLLVSHNTIERTGL